MEDLSRGSWRSATDVVPDCAFLCFHEEAAVIDAFFFFFSEIQMKPTVCYVQDIFFFLRCVYILGGIVSLFSIHSPWSR